MRLVHYHFGTDGGAEGFFVHLVNGLAARGIEQKVVIRPRRQWRKEIDQVAEVMAESHFRRLSVSRLTLPGYLSSVYREWQPDAILAWMSRAGHLLPASSPALRMARLGTYPGQLKQFMHADVLICNTPGVAAHVRRLGWKRGIRMISNFTSTEQVVPICRQELGTPEHAPVICTVGRLVHIKGVDVLIRSLRYAPEFYLWIVGDGEKRSALESLAQELKVQDRVRFLGWKTDPRPYTRASNISVMASRHEALGNVILEAWTQRVPVVSSRSAGPLWFVRDGENGLLVDIDDVVGFAAAFRKIVADPRLANRLIQGGVTTLENQFSEQAIVDQYLEVLAEQRAVAAA